MTRAPGSIAFVLSVLLPLTACAPAAPLYDVVLSGGRVMDPASGLDSVRNVGIKDGKIAAVSTEALKGTTVVDVTGKVVAPGFIDLHAHGQDAGDMEIQSRDGVTTALELEVGVYPVAPWYQSMEGKAPVNYGATVGHIPARFKVFHGIDVGDWPLNPQAAMKAGLKPAGTNAAASDSQVAAIADLLRQGLDEGALGIGFGVNYTPGAAQSEIERMFAVAAERKVPAFIHTRAFGIGAIREAIESALRTGASLHVVHIGSSSGPDLPQALALIDSVKASGKDLTTEVYPYIAGSTRLESAMFNPGWQQNLKIDYGELQWPLTGERLTKATFDKYRAQGGWVILFTMKDENIDKAVAHPGVLIASDGVPFVNGTGHPRGAGTFSRVLGRYVREKKLLSLMDGLAKMTILPARRVEAVAPAMKNKGRVSVGADADITVFDPATVVDNATWEHPTLPPTGITQVLVNGQFVVRDGQSVKGVMAGRPVRGLVKAAPPATH